MNAVPMVVECCELSMIGIQNFIETGSSCIRETFLILLAMMLFQILARMICSLFNQSFGSHVKQNEFASSIFLQYQDWQLLPSYPSVTFFDLGTVCRTYCLYLIKKNCHLLTFNHLIKEQSGRLIGKGKYCYSIWYIHHYDNHI